jgi:ubiquinone/menaquinone biosynthesis C-methylase UbiE
VLARANAFDRWFASVSGAYDFVLTFIPGWASRLRKAIGHIEGPRVLEISFGSGYLLALYANRFTTTGLDYNPQMLAMAQKRLAARGVKAELVRGDAHALPFADGSFETVVNTDAFTLYADPNKAMAEIFRVLVPGGRLILMEYDYPKDRNWLGMRLMVLPRLLKMPYIDFSTLLKQTGFTWEDHPVGMAGVLHMFIAHKPTESETA